jgi:hypothetical protein
MSSDVCLHCWGPHDLLDNSHSSPCCVSSSRRVLLQCAVPCSTKHSEMLCQCQVTADMQGLKCPCLHELFIILLFCIEKSVGAGQHTTCQLECGCRQLVRRQLQHCKSCIETTAALAVAGCLQLLQHLPGACRQQLLQDLCHTSSLPSKRQLQQLQEHLPCWAADRPQLLQGRQQVSSI